MNKQIDEMQKIIDLNVFTYDGEEKVYGTKGAAEILYNKGYRKSTDVAREIFEAIYRISIGCSIENDVMRLTLEKEPYVRVVLASEFDKIRKKYESEGEK